VIRPARPEDVPVLVELVHAAYRGEGGWTTEAGLIDGTRTDAQEITELLPDLLVAEDSATGQVLGCCGLTARGDHGYFGTFAVRPDLQGGGVGSALLTAAEDRARALGLAAVEMTVVSLRRELIDYYLRRGYVDTGQTRPFPYGVARNGRPRRDDLEFAVLHKPLHPA
jgi:N-acetylglutamate synthase-like GNAT family acetyltransferase